MFKRRGGGSKAFWTMLKKTALFLHGGFPYTKKPFYSEIYCALPILICTALTILIFMAIINIILNNINHRYHFEKNNPHLLLVHGLPSHPRPKLGPRSEQVLQVTNNKFYSRVLYPSNSHIFQWNKNIFFLFRQDQFLRIKTFPFYLSPSASFPFPGLVDWAVSKRALDGSEEKMRFNIKEASFLFISFPMIWFWKSAQPEVRFSDIVNRLLLAGETSQPGAELSSCEDRGVVFAIYTFNQDYNSSLIITFWL